jgi:hypothetical protein
MVAAGFSLRWAGIAHPPHPEGCSYKQGPLP